MINTFFWEKITKIINAYLQLDPDISQRLAPLDNKNIKIVLMGLPIDVYFFLQFQANQVVINNEKPLNIDAELKGSYLAFIKKSFSNKHNTSLQEIELIGDVEVGQHLDKLMNDLEIDWEELLSHYTGDIVAHQVGSQIRSSWNWLTSSAETALMNITEYVQEEIHYFPPRAEIEDFYADIDELSMDFSRLEARYDLLCQE